MGWPHLLIVALPEHFIPTFYYEQKVFAFMQIIKDLRKSQAKFPDAESIYHFVSWDILFCVQIPLASAMALVAALLFHFLVFAISHVHVS